ncbi:MAG: DUF3786 domain-containing protein [Deltaproteobacteria bacterium]|jgi:hypothetical protein|nr:DUF3786 domain-containing protein [Deltaproteobacteria bacterium]
MKIYEMEVKSPAFLASPELWEDLISLPPEKVALHSGAELLPDSKTFKLFFLGGDYLVHTKERLIVHPENRPALDYQETVVLLTYLTISGSGPAPGLSGKEISPWGIPLGDFFFKGPHELAKAPLAQAFGKDAESLWRILASLGGNYHTDQSYRLKILPFVEVYIYLEPEDIEFPAEARFNFDSHIHFYLRLDGIFALINCLVKFLIHLKNTENPQS